MKLDPPRPRRVVFEDKDMDLLLKAGRYFDKNLPRQMWHYQGALRMAIKRGEAILISMRKQDSKVIELIRQVDVRTETDQSALRGSAATTASESRTKR